MEEEEGNAEAFINAIRAGTENKFIEEYIDVEIDIPKPKIFEKMPKYFKKKLREEYERKITEAKLAKLAIKDETP